MSDPTYKDVREFLARQEITASEAGRMSGVKARTFRRYVCEPGAPGAAQMPWAVWAILRLIYKEKTLIEIRAEALARGAADDDGKGD